MLKIHEFFLSFFYSGKAKKAPGTFGSMASLFFWLIITAIFFNHEISLKTQNIFWGIFLLTILIYGTIAAPIYTKNLGKIDHQTIVLDETLGQILSLQMSYYFLHENYFMKPYLICFHLIISFAFFRLFDITKPFVIGYCDQKLKNGFGVMFDDLLAGLAAGFLGILILSLLKLF